MGTEARGAVLLWFDRIKWYSLDVPTKGLFQMGTCLKARLAFSGPGPSDIIYYSSRKNEEKEEGEEEEEEARRKRRTRRARRSSRGHCGRIRLAAIEARARQLALQIIQMAAPAEPGL